MEGNLNEGVSIFLGAEVARFLQDVSLANKRFLIVLMVEPKFFNWKD